MAAASSLITPAQTFDDRGRALLLTDDEVRARNALALAALDEIDGIGDDAEQRETLDYLMRVVDQDRLSDRPRFVQ
jgi:hypothetical protein